jgi:hypothetical protein
MYNNLHFGYSGNSPDNAACSSLATTIFTAMAGHNQLWTADVSLSEVVVLDLASKTGGVGTHSGTAAGGTTPGGTDNSMAVLVNYKIARRYRGGKPRTYLPWGSGADLANRTTFLSSSVTAWTNAMVSFFSSIIGQTAGGCTISAHNSISYYEGFDVHTDPGTGRATNVPRKRPTPLVDSIVGLTVSNRPGNQRRRL